MNENMSLEEKWKSATLANNFIFYKVMHSHPDACKRLVEMLLNIKIDKIVMAAESVIEIDYDAKGIRLDVYLQDSQRIIDVEMQVKDTKSLPERARYYQSAMDIDDLPVGGKYSSMKDNHVIFICLQDFINKDLPVYTFQNYCSENKDILLNDRTWKHFFIAETCAKMLENKSLRAFFELIISNNATTGFTDELMEYINDAKHNTQWRQQFMIWENNLAEAKEQARIEGLAEGLAEGRKEGREEGLAEGRKEGREEGLAEGRKEGHEEGLAEGRQEAILSSAITAVKDFNLDPVLVAQKFNVPVDQLKETLSNVSQTESNK